LLEYCRRHHKLISGGSDCHGDFATQRVLGRPEIYLEDLNLGGLLV
jgi:3',5'-nucleoside bisphosphate phosphatase